MQEQLPGSEMENGTAYVRAEEGSIALTLRLTESTMGAHAVAVCYCSGTTGCDDDTDFTQQVIHGEQLAKSRRELLRSG